MIDYKIFSDELLFELRSEYYDMVWDFIEKNDRDKAKYCAKQLKNVEDEILARGKWNEYLKFVDENEK